MCNGNIENQKEALNGQVMDSINLILSNHFEVDLYIVSVIKHFYICLYIGREYQRADITGKIYQIVANSAGRDLQRKQKHNRNCLHEPQEASSS